MTTPADSPDALVRRLVTCGADLPPDLRAAILAAGHDAVAPLIAVLTDPTLRAADDPDGYAPIHATRLLGALRAPEAIAPLLDLLADTTPLEVLFGDLLDVLPAFGAPVLEPALARLAAARDPEARYALRAVLAKLGVRDERVLQALARGLLDNLALGAGELAEYGDPRALPALYAAVERYEPKLTGLLADQDLIELDAAIRELGGELTPAMQRKLDAVRAADERARRELFGDLVTEISGAKVGRNDPCPCGSGKKYKKCCLGKT